MFPRKKQTCMSDLLIFCCKVGFRWSFPQLTPLEAKQEVFSCLRGVELRLRSKQSYSFSNAKQLETARKHFKKCCKQIHFAIPTKGWILLSSTGNMVSFCRKGSNPKYPDPSRLAILRTPPLRKNRFQDGFFSKKPFGFHLFPSSWWPSRYTPVKPPPPKWWQGIPRTLVGLAKITLTGRG